MSTQARQSSPFGSKKQCEKANKQLEMVIRAAREAHDSTHPSAVRRHAGREYRKHPNHDVYYHLEECFRGERPHHGPDHYESSYALLLSILDEHDRTITFIIYTYPPETATQLNRSEYSQALNAPMAANENVDRFDEVLGEGYATLNERPRSNTFRHLCLDRSVKVLKLIPDPMFGGGHPIDTRKVTIYLSESNQLFKAEKNWGLFLATEAGNERVAFEALETLDTCTNKALLKSISSSGGRSEERKTFYRFVPDDQSERYFRKNSQGDFEEYRTHPAHGEPHILTFSRPHIQASLGLRKARIYGDENDLVEDRF